MTLVSILIPTFQEREFVRACVESVLAFDLPGDVQLEIFVLDGGSTDGTREIAADIARREPRLRLVDNPERIQSTALNIGIRLSRGDYLMRLDAHSTYPRDYLRLCLAAAVRTGADNVGGLCIARPRGAGYQASLVQALTSHKFGVGDSGFRTGASEGPADTVPFGFFPREVFERVGLFDVRLKRAQDFEFNRRIARMGGRIWLDPAICVFYYNQPGLVRFLQKQIVKEAPYNAYLWYVAPYAFVPRHAVTAVFTAGVIGGLLLAPFSKIVAGAFVLVMGLYALLAIGSAVQQAVRYREWRHALTLPFCFFAYHFLHGVGVVYGLARLLTGTAPVQRMREPWPGAGRTRAWPPDPVPGV